MSELQDCIIRARVDSRELAAIADHYRKHQRLPRTRNALVVQIIRDFCAILQANNQAPLISSSEDAVRMLHKFGYTKLVEKVTSSEDYLKKLELEHYLSEGPESEEVSSSLTELARGIASRVRLTPNSDGE